MDPRDWNDPISTFLNLRRVEFVKKLSPALVTAALLLSLLALTGWAKDIVLLDELSKAYFSNKPAASLGIVLLSASILLPYCDRGSRALRVFALSLAVIPLLVGVLAALSYLMPMVPGIDHLLFRERALAAGPETLSGRMAPTSVSCLILLGCGMLTSGLKRRRGLTFSHACASVAFIVALFSVIGYFYGVAGLLGFGVRSGMELNAAVCFLLLALGILCQRPDHDLPAILLSDGPGGYVARRLVPVAVVLPVALGELRVWGEHAGLYASDLGTTAFSVFTIVLLVTIVWWTALLLQRLEIRRIRIDAERERLAIEARLRDQFQSMLSHDLRNPLAVARMSTDMICKLAERSTPVESFAERARLALDRTDRMIEDLLDSSRIKAGQPVILRISDCELNAIIGETLEDLKLVHGPRFVFEPGPQVEGHWDRTALRRVIENLCNNSVKYGLPGRPITVAINALDCRRVALSIHNEGGGISADQAMTLFEPFQRASDAIALSKKGWGIGLTLVKAVIEAHGGKVSVRSDESTGTTFTLELPRDARVESGEGSDTGARECG